MPDRVVYVLFASFVGALLGLACWWLYGLGHSLQYDGPGLDPVLLHWVSWLTGFFALAALWLGERVGDILGDSISTIFHFEIGETPDDRTQERFFLALLIILLLLLWLTAPACTVRSFDQCKRVGGRLQHAPVPGCAA